MALFAFYITYEAYLLTLFAALVEYWQEVIL